MKVFFRATAQPIRSGMHKFQKRPTSATLTLESSVEDTSEVVTELEAICNHVDKGSVRHTGFNLVLRRKLQNLSCSAQRWQ